MATSSNSKRMAQAATADSAGAMAGAQSLSEVTRQQMAAGVQAVSTWFRAMETVQRAQLQMGERAALLHQQAAENIRRATTPMELASIQSTLVVYEMQEAMRYWQELFTAVGSVGSESLRPAETTTDATGAATSPAATMMGAAMSAAAPMADALQQMFTAPMKAAATAANATH